MTGGCDAAPGYLWSPALPLEDLVTLVAALPGGRFDVEVPPATAPGRTG